MATIFSLIYIYNFFLQIATSSLSNINIRSKLVFSIEFFPFDVAKSTPHLLSSSCTPSLLVWPFSSLKPSSRIFPPQGDEAHLAGSIHHRQDRRYGDDVTPVGNQRSTAVITETQFFSHTLMDPDSLRNHRGSDSDFTLILYTFYSKRGKRGILTM